MGHGVPHAPAQMLHQRLLGAGAVVEGDGVVQDGPVPGLGDVGVGAGHQPQGVVVEAAAHVAVAPLGEGLVLVIGGPVGELDRGDVDDPLPGPVRAHVDEPQQVLAAVPEAHAPPGARLVEAGGAAHVEGDHALILVPGVDHGLQLPVPALQAVDAQQLLPVVPQLRQGLLRPPGGGEFFHHAVGVVLADHAGGEEFRLPGIPAVAQHEKEAPLLPGGQGHVQGKARHGRAAVGQKIAGPPVHHRLRGGEGAELSQKGVPVRVVSGDVPVDAVPGVVVPALPVLGGVVEDVPLPLHLAGVQVPLEVGGVVHGVPQAPLHRRGEPEGFLPVRLVFQHRPLDLAGLPDGHEEGQLDGQAVPGGLKDGVAHAVTAAVAVQRGVGGMEGGAPQAAVRLLDVEETSAHVRRNAVVAVAQQALELGVPVEAVAARGVADEGKELLAAQVVDPGQGGGGGLDDVLPPPVVEKAELHGAFPPQNCDRRIS